MATGTWFLIRVVRIMALLPGHLNALKRHLKFQMFFINRINRMSFSRSLKTSELKVVNRRVCLFSSSCNLIQKYTVDHFKLKVSDSFYHGRPSQSKAIQQNEVPLRFRLVWLQVQLLIRTVWTMPSSAPQSIADFVSSHNLFIEALHLNAFQTRRSDPT